MNLTPEEARAVAQCFADWASAKGEDVIGILMLSGAFHHVGKSGGVSALATKIELSAPDLFSYIIPGATSTNEVEYNVRWVKSPPHARRITSSSY